MNKKILYTVFGSLLFLIFFIQNKSVVNIKFLIFSFDVSIKFLFSIMAIFGFLCTYGIFSVICDNYKRAIRKKNNHINRLKKENSKINSANFGNEIKKDYESIIYDEFLKNIYEEKNNLKIEVKKESKTIDNVEIDDIYNQLSTALLDYKEKGYSLDKSKKDTKKTKDNEQIKKAFSKIESVDKKDFSIHNKKDMAIKEPWYKKAVSKKQQVKDVKIIDDENINIRRDFENIINDTIKTYETTVDETIENIYKNPTRIKKMSNKKFKKKNTKILKVKEKSNKNNDNGKKKEVKNKNIVSSDTTKQGTFFNKEKIDEEKQKLDDTRVSSIKLPDKKNIRTDENRLSKDDVMKHFNRPYEKIDVANSGKKSDIKKFFSGNLDF